MYIKQIIINGFKSYKEETVLDTFDRRHNVVVGRNGSGKSNFFLAIQFVLSDDSTSFGDAESRQNLTHEGTRSGVDSNFVEIVFDNSEHRVPIDVDEITLRRTVGPRKDSYRLNKKSVSRVEVINLLQTAGFSYSNPYYIVKQGRINQIATAVDSYRLKLIQEVAGTRLYDEKKQKTLEILKESEKTVSKINEFLHTIEDRLKTLTEEGMELREYLKSDKLRRCVEYCIFERDLKEADDKLQEINDVVRQADREQKRRTDELNSAAEEAKQVRKKLKAIQAEVQTAKDEKDVINTDSQQLTKEKARLTNVIKDLLEEVERNNDSKNQAEQKLIGLNATIQEKQTQLDELRPKYEAEKAKEQELYRRLELEEQKRKELNAMQGRRNQFTSKEERDDWIKRELNKLNKQIAEEKENEKTLAEDVQGGNTKKVTLENKIAGLKHQLESFRQLLDDHNRQMYDAKKKKDELQGKKNELWKKEAQLTRTLSLLKETLTKHDQNLRSIAGKPISTGRDSLTKVLQVFRQRGGQYEKLADQYYGQVIENFNCRDTVTTAVEVTAGKRLFYHIVESDRVGTEILKEFHKQQLSGEITFMPRNRLRVVHPNFTEENDAIPMVSCLRYDEMFDKVMLYIFGKTIICRDLEGGADISKRHGVDCITIQGDQVSSKGTLTGGYFKKKRSQLDIQKQRTSLLDQIKDMEKELTELRYELEALETRITAIVSESQKIETKNSKAKANLNNIKSEICMKREELQSIEKYQPLKEQSLNQCALNLSVMETTKERLETELCQDLMSQLSEEEQAELYNLNKEIELLNQEIKATFSSRRKLEEETNKLKNLLQNNLRRRHEELDSALQEISVEGCTQTLEISKLELKTVEDRIAVLKVELEGLDKKLRYAMKKQKRAQGTLESFEEKEREAQKNLESDTREFTTVSSKQAVFRQKVEDCRNKINDLGTIPSNILLSKYIASSREDLFKELAAVNHELKKFNRVNRKALDQLCKFSEQKDKLIKRKEEWDGDEEKFRELIDHLELEKCEAIKGTFRQVAFFFSEVFQKLVPGGSAELVLEDRNGSFMGNVTQMNEDISNYHGVSMKVKFADQGEMRRINALSGGQKSLVALAFIFAIQKCDPAPFYLLDEIDQALDAQHRKAVALMIREMSEHAQFITTTFRPELLEHAHKCYGVTFRNRVSHIQWITKEDAYDFVEDDTPRG